MLMLLLMVCTIPVWGRPQAPIPGQPAQQPQAAVHSGSATSPIPIVSQSESVGADGSFNFSYETGNGIHVQEGGYVKKAPLAQRRTGALNADGSQSDAGEGDVQVITGGFSYTAPDGTEISLKYVADENGFHPEGAHLPTPPPIPPEIQRALNLLPNKTEQERPIQTFDSPQENPVDLAQGSATNIEEDQSSFVPNIDIIQP